MRSKILRAHSLPSQMRSEEQGYFVHALRETTWLQSLCQVYKVSFPPYFRCQDVWYSAKATTLSGFSEMSAGLSLSPPYGRLCSILASFIRHGRCVNRKVIHLKSIRYKRQFCSMEEKYQRPCEGQLSAQAQALILLCLPQTRIGQRRDYTDIE